MSSLPPLSAHQAVLLTTTALLLALLGLGLRLQWGQPQRARWLHHWLFFAVVVGVAGALLLGWRAGEPGWALIPALLALLSMPATQPGRAGHWQRALVVSGLFAVGAFLTW